MIFILLYFSIQFGGIILSINDEGSENKSITPILSNGKSVSFKWSRTWGGANWDIGTGVTVDLSDNVYVAGYTSSFGAGNYDMVLVKYDGNGTQQWNRTWGGDNDDSGYGVAIDSSDNVYLAGHTDSFGAGGADMVLVKYDGNGTQQWNRTWGGDDYDYGYGVAGDSLDNVYLVGSTRSFGAGGADMVLMKYDGNGTQQWNRTWGGANSDYGTGVAIDSSDNVYLAGGTESFGAGGGDMVLIKYDGNGTQQWNRTWGGDNDDSGYGVAIDSSDNVYLAGATYSFGAGESDMVLIKYDGNGTQQGTRTWGGADWDGGSGVAVDSLDNVYLAGTTYSFGAGGDDMVLVKYSNVEQPASDGFTMVLIIAVSIASIVGVGIAITYFIRKRRKIVE